MYNFSIGFCAVSTSPPCDSLTRQSHSIVATHRSRLRYAQHISSALRIGGYTLLSLLVSAMVETRPHQHDIAVLVCETGANAMTILNMYTVSISYYVSRVDQSINPLIDSRAQKILGIMILSGVRCRTVCVTIGMVTSLFERKKYFHALSVHCKSTTITVQHSSVFI